MYAAGGSEVRIVCDLGSNHAVRVAERDRAAVDEPVQVDPRSRWDGMTCAANALLISTRSRSSMVMPAFASAPGRLHRAESQPGHHWRFPP